MNLSEPIYSIFVDSSDRTSGTVNNFNISLGASALSLAPGVSHVNVWLSALNQSSTDEANTHSVYVQMNQPASLASNSNGTDPVADSSLVQIGSAKNNVVTPAYATVTASSAVVNTLNVIRYNLINGFNSGVDEWQGIINFQLITPHAIHKKISPA